MIEKNHLRFWIGLGVIVALAAVPLFLSFDFSLPYIDHPSEPNKYLGALEMRGLYDFNGYSTGYPPGYLVFVMGVQLIGEPFGLEGVGNTYFYLRFISALLTLAALVFTALAARLAAGDLAGWVAGAAWGVSPYVVQNGVYAIQDPFVYMWVSLALFLAAAAVTDEGRKWLAVWSVAAGLLAIIFKYPVVPAILPGLVVALIYVVRDWRSNWPVLAAPTALTGVIGVWLLLRVQTMTDVHRLAGESVSPEGLSNLFDVARVTNNLFHAFKPLNPLAFLIVFLAGVAAFIVATRTERPRIDWRVVGLAALLLLTIPWLASLFSWVTDNSANDRMRDVLPAAAAGAVILGAAIAQITAAFPEKWRLPATIAVPVLLVGLVFVPHGIETAALVQDRMPDDRRVEVRLWADENLEAGTVIVTKANEKVFNPDFGGISGRQWFSWWRTEDITEYPLDEWINQRGMTYALIPMRDIRQIAETPEGRDYLRAMLPLRQFLDEPGVEYRGVESVFFRLWRMEHETDYLLGEHIHLLGYDQSAARTTPGEPVTFRFYWQADAQPQANYSLFVHLMPLDEVEVLT